MEEKPVEKPIEVWREEQHIETGWPSNEFKRDKSKDIFTDEDFDDAP